MVDFGDWGLGRREIALLRCEEAWLARCVDLGGGSSRRVRSGSTTRRGRGRESKVDSIGEESVYWPPLVIVSHTKG
jgi:hypothetical protein